MKIRSIKLEVEGLFKLEGKIEWFGESSPPVVVPEPPVVVVPEPPVVVVPEPPVVTPPVQVGVQNITQDWLDALQDETVTAFRLGEGTYKVEHITRVPRTKDLKIVAPANRATVLFGPENYDKWNAKVPQSEYLIHLSGKPQILIDNVNICQPKQLKTAEPWRPAIFSSDPLDINGGWTAVVRNCDTVVMGRHGGFGLGYIYGGLNENHLAAMNFNHVGSLFVDAKAGLGGNPNTVLCLTLEDVVADGSNEEEFGSYKVKADALIYNNVYEIKSPEAYTWQMRNQLFNTSDRGAQGNYAHIIHVGRFTFMLDPDQVIDDKRIRLRPNAHGSTFIRVIGGKVYTIGKESHAGDIFVLNGVVHSAKSKHRDVHPIWTNNNNWRYSDITYTPYLVPDIPIEDGEYTVEWSTSFNLEGKIQPTWMLYKESPYKFHSYPNTLFEDPLIMSGGVIGQHCYNHANTSIRAVRVKQRGYYRQSGNGGKCLYYHIEDCEGFKNEFNPPVPLTRVPFPQRVLDLL